MKLEIDLKRIAQLAREREDENWQFYSFLKRGIDLETEELDAIVHNHYKAVTSQIDCRACANCCRNMRVVLSLADISRLAAGLSIPEPQLIQRYLHPGDEKDTYTFNSKPCPFLSGNTCTVYESRPDACRSFPHLHKKDFVFRLHGVLANYTICPIVFNVLECLKDELRSSRADDLETELEGGGDEPAL